MAAALISSILRTKARTPSSKAKVVRTLTCPLGASGVVQGNAGRDVIAISGALADQFSIKVAQVVTQSPFRPALNTISGGIYAGGGADTIQLFSTGGSTG